MVKTKKKAAQVTAKISALTISSAAKPLLARLKSRLIKSSTLKTNAGLSNSGMTLLEIIVAVAIIASIVTLVLPRLNSRSNEIRATVRKIAILSRELKNLAKLQNATYRLVIHMGEEDGKPKHEFWVERGQGAILNDYDPKKPPTLPDPTKEKPEDEPPPAFTRDTKVLKKPEALPNELIFESVELASVDKPITEGLVYIHYLPTGFADEAVIHLKQGEKINWSLAIQPLTGRIDIIDENRSLRDLRSQ